jgi:hypothetical protein
VRKLMYASHRDCTVRTEPSVPNYLQAIRQQHPEITFVDPNLVICKGAECNPIVDNTPVYRDDGHLNEVGSRLIGTMLLQRGVSLIHDDAMPMVVRSAM